MGKSDKPDMPYHFADHVPFVDGFIETLGLKDVTLVIHDWGSALGFHYARRHADNVRGIVFMKGIVRPVTWARFPPDFRGGFRLMRTPGLGWAMISGLNMLVEKLLPSAVVRKLTPEEMAIYRAPYPNVRSRRPLRVWPCEVPIDGSPADAHAVVETYSRWLGEADTPMLMFFASPGGNIEESGRRMVSPNHPQPGGRRHWPGHSFLQEDNPHHLAGVRTPFLDRYPARCRTFT